MDRRSFMKASGLAATLGVTGLAGCSGFLGGSGSGAGSWQYDPGTLADTSTRFFGSMQYGNLYSMRDQLPGSMQDSFETSSESPIGPGDIDLVTGVGGGQLSMQANSGAFFGSAAVTGSFDAGSLRQQIESEGSAQQTGTYSGYTLYEGTDLGQTMPGSQMPGQSMSTSATAAVSDEALVLGVTVDQGTGIDVTGETATTTMIDARAGKAPRLTRNSEGAKKLQDSLGDATMVVGGEVDAELVQTYREQAASGGGMGMGQMLEGLRAGGFSGDIGPSTTTYKFAIVYDNATNAENSGIVGLVNMMKQRMTQQEGVNSVSSSQNGDTITVTVKGDTQTLLSQGGGQVPMGATAGNAVPIDY